MTLSSKPSEPVVSVLMPVRNEQENVKAALESVLAQDVPLEILVVDAMSTDHTRRIVEAIGDRRIRILDNPRRIIPAGLNVGLTNATGSFVARVDGHMRIGPGYLATALAVLAAEPQLAAVGGIRHAEALSSTGRAIATALGSPFGVGNSVNHYGIAPQDTDHATCGVYRVEIARAMAGWDENLLVNEDVDFDHRILRAGHRIRFDPRMRVFWRVRESLPAFARQYRRYGRGKAQMVRKNGPAAVRVRHLVAPALVGVLGAAAGAAVTGRTRLATGLATPYVGALALAVARTVREQRSESRPRPLRLAAAFATMHITWGVGFLEGYLLRRPPAAATSRDPRPSVSSVPR